MKKALGKPKNTQVFNSKGCMKISSFFTKQTKNKENTDIKTNANVETKKVINLLGTTTEETANSEANEKLVLSPISRKRKLGETCSVDTQFNPPLKKSSNINEQLTVNGNACCSKDISQIVVKSVEKLLSPKALKEYRTPEKIMDRFLNKIRTPTPKKLSFNCETTQKLAFSKEKNKKVATPKKSVNISEDETTPTKSRRTPKKLFDKSPSNLSEFNVEIVNNFVKITPSKSNKKVFKDENSETRLHLTQLENEKTPVKGSPSKKVTTPYKVKTKLDFSDSFQEKISSPKTSPCKNVVLNNLESNEITETAANLDSLDFGDFQFSDSWDGLIGPQVDYNLDLTVSEHCKIVNLTHVGNKKTIVVKSTATNEQAICNLEGFWVYSQLSIGDTIHLTATKINDSEWLIDNKNGLLVFEPDLLISTTTIVNAVFCKRKNILSEKYKGFDPTNKFMVIGVLVHSLLQGALKDRIHTHEQVESLARKLVESQETVRTVYESGIPMLEIQEEILGFVPKIVDFINAYVIKNNKNVTNYQLNKENWKGTIKYVDDIEENIWCPDLGIKGKVDVSVRTDFQTLPLELKTGRASVSLEHRGQVILYIMMMNKFGYNVSSGLLLYLRENVLKEIRMTDIEKRDIMMLRNEITYFLTREPKIIDKNGHKYLKPGEIPEPISHVYCAKCPYNTICTAYAKYNNEDISNNKLLKNIQDQVAFHISENHIEYFMKWSSLISLEMSHTMGTKNLKEIYTVPPNEREANSRCIANLKVLKTEPECNGVTIHTFGKIDGCPTNFILTGILQSNYVVISTDKRPAVSTGFVTDVTANSISVSLDRDLNKKYANTNFHIDTYDSTTFQTFNLSSLTLLMEITPRAEQLRRIVIDKQLPTFQPKLPKVIAEKGKPILKRLNRVQQRAVLKAIAANEYFLIEGMPGTGKTATIVALIQLLLELKKTILITSHTHSAVDNVCIRLIKYGVKLMRLGNEAKINESLKEFSEYNLTKHCKTPQELESVYNNTQILAVTCLGSGHPVLSKRTLDICIVDESTQVLQCSVLRPIYTAKTFILIGDPHQLPAVVKQKDAIELGMTESLFERLICSNSMTALNLNYRMNEPITALANALTYNGELLIGAEHVGKATLKIPDKKIIYEKYKGFKWLLNALDDSLENSIQFIDTGPVWTLQHEVSWNKHPSIENNDSQNSVNVYEAAIACHLVKALLLGGISPDKIGVMATFRSQAGQISLILSNTDVDISTVDQFQGKDKEVVIYSCTKSRANSQRKASLKYELLEDKKRLTVAITRAKHKLIILGDKETLVQFSTFQKIMPLLERNVLTVKENVEWKSVLNLDSS